MKAISIVGILALTLFCPAVLHASSVQVTVIGTEQNSTSGTFDVGTATITVSGYAKSVQYGRFSNDASVASAIAAAFSLDCHSPVIARAKGAVITFSSRDSFGEPSNLTASLTWDSADFSAASFAFNFPPPSTVTTAINCSPNVINSGENLSCVVSGLPSQTSSVVTFNVIGTAWSSAQPAGGEAITNAVLTEATPATYSIGFNYPGDANNPPASGQTSVVVNSPGSAPSGSPVYAFAIAQGGHLGVAPSGSVSGYDAVGNVTAYTDSVNGDWQLGYDSLNRLTISQSQPTNVSAQFGCWMYDSFGNMLTQGISGAAFQTGCQAQPGVVTLQNSFTYTAANQMSSAVWHDAQKNTHSGTLGYDGSGNVTNDLNNQYLYDAEGHVCAVQGLYNGQAQGTITGYLYDAEGSRVAKGTLNAFSCDPAAMTQMTSIYFIGPNGETMTEVDRNLNLVRTDVMAAGQLLADYTPTGVHYPIVDWLGTKRVQVTGSGAWPSQLTVEDTYASLPYGDGLVESAPALDASTKFFTGKERDTESGLDYFGARYYASNMGRWMSPDWSSKAVPVPYADLKNPQSLNLYGYLGNNPLRGADPDGHCDWCQRLKNAIRGDGWKTNAELPSVSVVQGPGRAIQKLNGIMQTVNDVAMVVMAGAVVIDPLLAPEEETLEAEQNGMILGSADSEVGDNLLDAAQDAIESLGEGNGPVYGTKVHSAFEANVNALGDSSLSTEVSYKNGIEVPRGTPDSVRVDVVHGPKNAPTAVYDLKTGGAKLTSARIQQIQANIPGGNKVPVYEIKP